MSPWLYILPAMLIIMSFRFIPIIMSFVISFFDWSFTGIGDFVGIQNYISLIKDQEFWESMLNTFYLVIFVVPLTIVFSLTFAVLLNQIKFLKSFFRTVYFIPFVTSLVALSIVWKIILNQQYGLANAFLGLFGIEPLRWLAEPEGIFTLLFRNIGVELPVFLGGPSLALFSIILVTIWRGVGYATIIYLAGLQNISQSYYEAAEIDGASKLRQFFKITLPLIAPTTYFVLMMKTITTFQVFSQVYMMTGPPVGGPQGTTKVIVYYIFENGFGEAQNLAYASTIALVLFLIILTLTLIQRKFEKKVHYN